MVDHSERSPRPRCVVDNQLAAGVGICLHLVSPRQQEITLQGSYINHVHIAKIPGMSKNWYGLAHDACPSGGVVIDRRNPLPGCYIQDLVVGDAAETAVTSVVPALAGDGIDKVVRRPRIVFSEIDKRG